MNQARRKLIQKTMEEINKPTGKTYVGMDGPIQKKETKWEKFKGLIKKLW